MSEPNKYTKAKRSLFVAEKKDLLTEEKGEGKAEVEPTEEIISSEVDMGFCPLSSRSNTDKFQDEEAVGSAQSQDLPSPLTRKDDRKVAKNRKQNRSCNGDPELRRTMQKSKVGMRIV